MPQNSAALLYQRLLHETGAVGGLAGATAVDPRSRVTADVVSISAALLHWPMREAMHRFKCAENTLAVENERANERMICALHIQADLRDERPSCT